MLGLRCGGSGSAGSGSRAAAASGPGALRAAAAGSGAVGAWARGSGTGALRWAAAGSPWRPSSASRPSTAGRGWACRRRGCSAWPGRAACTGGATPARSASGAAWRWWRGGLAGARAGPFTDLGPCFLDLSQLNVGVLNVLHVVVLDGITSSADRGNRSLLPLITRLSHCSGSTWSCSYVGFMALGLVSGLFHQG